MTQKTPLYDWHVEQGAKVVPFAGFMMPVAYAGTLAEHQAVREQCGLFDISHMGEVYVEGPQALAFVQWITSNDAARLQDHQAQYSLLMHEEGYAIDDLLVYRLSETRFLLCINAANIAPDWDWIATQAKRPEFAQVKIENASEQTTMFALQGPNSFAVMGDLGFDLKSMERFSTVETKIAGIDVLLSRTGYTGEDGCEFFLSAGDALAFWEALFAAAKPHGGVPVGLGARDTLRLEMGYVLYGHELSPSISPWEAKLGWVIKLAKGDFLGKAALEKQKAEGLPRTLVALQMEEAGIPREGMAVILGEEKIGEVVSGTMSPTLRQGIATALVKREHASQTEFLVDIRGKMKKSKQVKLPFIKK